MKIAVHAKVLSEKELHGIGFYTYNLLKAISEIDNNNQYVTFSNQPIIHKINNVNFQEKILKFPKLWSYIRLPLEFVNNKFDLLFVPKEMVPPINRPKTIVTCHDLMNLYFSDHISTEGKIHFWLATNYALKSADRIIAVSESTKNDIIDKCKISPDKIHVIHEGYDSELYKPCLDKNIISKVKKQYGINSNFIINTSSLIWHRKNPVRLIKAFHMFKSKNAIDCRLVITGNKGDAYDETIKLIHSLKLEKDIIFTGYVNTEDMPVLLSSANALVFPSLHEGFGLPILEAMACGCPVITSNTSAMPEVLGNAGILVDPYSVEEIYIAIEEVLTGSMTREKMRKKGLEQAKLFSWEKTARETLKVFETVK